MMFGYLMKIILTTTTREIIYAQTIRVEIYTTAFLNRYLLGKRLQLGWTLAKVKVKVDAVFSVYAVLLSSLYSHGIHVNVSLERSLCEVTP